MATTLFWLHVVVIILAVLSGFFLPLYIVVLLIIIHKLHLIIFGDCILTLLKRYKSTIRPEENFLQYAVRALFSRKITKQVSENINYLIYTLTILASLSRSFW